MTVEGILIVKGTTQSYGSKGFQKREFVIETKEQYPQKIQIELTQDKCALIDNINVGADIIVSINLRGREWVNPQGEVKYFNSIQAWKIDMKEQGDVVDDEPLKAKTEFPSDKAVAKKEEPVAKQGSLLDNDENDLPF